MTLKLNLETNYENESFRAYLSGIEQATDAEISFGKRSLYLIAQLSFENIEIHPVVDLGTTIVFHESGTFIDEEYKEQFENKSCALGEVIVSTIDNGKSEIKGGNLSVSSIVSYSLLEYFNNNFVEHDDNFEEYDYDNEFIYKF